MATKFITKENLTAAWAHIKSKINSAKSEVIGKSGDAATANTIYGAKAYADSKLTTAGKIDSVKVNGTEVAPDASKAVNITVASGSTNGTLAVNGKDVAVKGLNSGAYANISSYLTTTAASDAYQPKGTYLTAHQTLNTLTLNAGKFTATTYNPATAKTITIPTNTSHLENDSNFITSTDISDKADKATTLAGYGIIDAKIENGVITLGSNTITPITGHQDLSEYASTADIKITGIQVGGTTITPSNKVVNITVATGDANGQVKIGGVNASVKGLGTAAYTNSTSFATPADIKITSIKNGSTALTIGADKSVDLSQMFEAYTESEILAAIA